MSLSPVTFLVLSNAKKTANVIFDQEMLWAGLFVISGAVIIIILSTTSGLNVFQRTMIALMAMVTFFIISGIITYSISKNMEE